MKVVIIHRTEGENALLVDEYMRDFTMRTGRSLEILDPDTPDGASVCRTYDIVEYPTVIALSDTGQMQNSWRGLPLPTISELSYYS